MNTRSVAIALLFAFAPMTVGTRSVFAQAPPADDASTKAARARFQEGVSYYDKGQFENARAAFLQAYALRKHPAVLVNLAQSSLRSGHTLEATNFFVQYLRESTSLTAAQRSDAEKGLADARAKLGRIEVAAPSGAEISLDGEKVGTAPLPDPLDVEPGAHKVSARTAEGVTDRSVSVTAGQQASAKFGPQSAPPVTPPPPTEPTTEPPPPTEPPPVKETPTPEKKTEGGWGIWSSGHLATYVPTVIGGVVSVGGFVTAIALAGSKSSAQNSATSVANEIIAAGGTQGTCYNPPASSRFYTACNTLASNNNNVNTDALVANIGGAIGVVGAVGALGWFLLGPRRVETSSAAPAAAPAPATSLVPYVGPGQGGLAVRGTF